MKVLSKTKGAAQEYGRWSVNPYLGCPHGCTYCYLQQPIWKRKLGGNAVILKDGIVSAGHAYHLAMAEIIEHREQIIRDGGLFMSFVTDPLCKETRKLFIEIAVDVANEYEIPVTILTKATDFIYTNRAGALFRDTDWYVRCFYPIAYGWTLTGRDDLEPNAPSNADRIEAMRIMSDNECPVWASIEPVIDFPSALDMVEQSLDAGCRHFKIGLQTYGNRVIRRMYDPETCTQFIHDVMHRTADRATVYWKQSARDFLGEEDYARATVGYPGIVEKDWSMFSANN